MESQYKVCEVKLTYKLKIKASEREKILSAENLILKQYSKKIFSKSF